MKIQNTTNEQNEFQKAILDPKLMANGEVYEGVLYVERVEEAFSKNHSPILKFHCVCANGQKIVCNYSDYTRSITTSKDLNAFVESIIILKCTFTTFKSYRFLDAITAPEIYNGDSITKSMFYRTVPQLEKITSDLIEKMEVITKYTIYEELFDSLKKTGIFRVLQKYSINRENQLLGDIILTIKANLDMLECYSTISSEEDKARHCYLIVLVLSIYYINTNYKQDNKELVTSFEMNVINYADAMFRKYTLTDTSLKSEINHIFGVLFCNNTPSTFSARFLKNSVDSNSSNLNYLIHSGNLKSGNSIQMDGINYCKL